MDVLQELNLGELQGGSLITENPSTQETLANVTTLQAKDIDNLIKDAEERFKAWQALPAPIRGDAIRQLGNALREQKDHLGSLVSLEMGKIKQEGDGEVQEMIDIADFAVGLSRMLYGKTIPSERPLHNMLEQWHPLGPVLVISAFNFPVAVWAWNAFIGAVCGNSIIWKPSPKTPLCSIAVQRICDEVMAKLQLPNPFLLMLTNDNQLVEKCVNDKRIPLVSFTGSTAVGKIVAENIGKRLGKSILELSGNNAIIVDETADLDLAIPAIVFGAVGTAGQRCTSTRRLFIHQSRYDEVIERLKQAYEQVKVGDPLSLNTLMGPLIDRQAVEEFQQAIKEARDSGGEVLVGGEVMKGDGYFVEPTLIKADNSWPVVQRETFGPILYVMNYKTLPEALDMHNAVAQGLSSAIFTENLSNAQYFLSNRGSDCGIANVNIGTSGAEIGGAFGGEKDTGGGRESGSDAWKAYMRRQTNTINWGKELPLAQGIKFDIAK